ncbi:sensor histidine kinase [Sporomusa rhizae]|uniref:sensor histidine kinase n=1 Tax=Sporomusa rhizae TaxID=357999 RepID=UPI00352A7177
MVFTLRRKKYAQYYLLLNTVFLVALTSALSVHPFDNHFRFTFGVTMLSILLLYFPRLPVITTASLSAVLIMGSRVLFYTVADSDTTLYKSLMLSLPALCYYIIFGLGFQVFRIRSNLRNIPVMILKLSFIDFVSNLVELYFRHTFSISESVGFFTSLVGVAVFRSILTAYGYYALKQYRMFIMAEDRLKRYTQLVMVFAKIKTELYFLQKSSQDIEQVMEESFLLFQELDTLALEFKKINPSSERALKIAKDIHEVKKDYYRVVKGIEDVVTPSAKESGMNISEIFYIIEQNTVRFLNVDTKKIRIIYKYDDDFVTDKHYMLVSILNNLIINAIEVCGEYGVIIVSQIRTGDQVIFSVEDNGHGIPDEDIELIFVPGYSTKYSETTGKMSTGLGLAHVKNLTEMLGGTLRVDSQIGRGTKFSVFLPFSKLFEERPGQGNSGRKLANRELH